MPLITRKLGSVYPHYLLDLGIEPPARLPHVIARVKGGCMRTIGLDLAVQTAHKDEGYLVCPALGQAGPNYSLKLHWRARRAVQLDPCAAW